MKTLSLDTDTKITLYINECYGCNRGKYQPLYDFILKHKINLSNFIVKRIELSLEWQEEAQSFAVGLPFVLFENQAIGKYAVSYEYFKKLTEEVEPNPHSRGAESVMHSDGTPPFLEDEK